MAKERLQKVLARAGIDSRRKCEELITMGVVRVNKKVIDTLPAFVDPDIDIITVDGKKLKPQEKVYYLLNKPDGVISTSKDPHARRKVVDLVPDDTRVFCVGRLDADTTGAIILTNDSDLANKLTHPRYELSKTYEVRVKGEITGQAIEALKKGIWLAEGKTKKAAIKILKRGNKESAIQITIRQGLNRQIRRMMVRVGYKVIGLKRTKIGNIELKGVGVGNYKKLTKSQVDYLKKVTSKNLPEQL